MSISNEWTHLQPKQTILLSCYERLVDVGERETSANVLTSQIKKGEII